MAWSWLIWLIYWPIHIVLTHILICARPRQLCATILFNHSGPTKQWTLHWIHLDDGNHGVTPCVGNAGGLILKIRFDTLIDGELHRTRWSPLSTNAFSHHWLSRSYFRHYMCSLRFCLFDRTTLLSSLVVPPCFLSFGEYHDYYLGMITFSSFGATSIIHHYLDPILKNHHHIICFIVGGCYHRLFPWHAFPCIAWVIF